MRKSFRQLGRGHFAQFAFWKFCFRERYSFGKNIRAVWFSSVRKTRTQTQYYQEWASYSYLHVLIVWIDYVWFILKKPECSFTTLPHFLLALFVCDLAFGNQHKNLIYNPCHLITHKSPQCVCSPHNHGHSAFLWPQRPTHFILHASVSRPKWITELHYLFIALSKSDIFCNQFALKLH